MCQKNFTFLCCGFFLLITLPKSQQNFINNEKRGDNLTMQYKADTDSTTIYSDEIKAPRYNMREKHANNTQYVHNHKDDDQIPINSTYVNHKENSTSQEVYKNLLEKNDSMSNKVFENFTKDSDERNIVPYEMCHDTTCILLCCPLGNRMSMLNRKCISEEIKSVFPNVYGYTNDSMQSENKRVDEFFQLAVHDSCQGTNSYIAPFDLKNDYKIFANSSIYLSYFQTFVKSTSYCLVIYLEREDDKFEVNFCLETVDEIKKSLVWSTEVRTRLITTVIYVSFRVMSSLLLMSIFLVYSILPELRNVHGFMLRNYSGALSIAYTCMVINMTTGQANVLYPIWIAIAFVKCFCFMSGYFWLSAMSFNLWRTFRGFSSLRRNVRQSGKKKLMYYVTFAYGCSFIVAVICVIMDFISPYVSKIMQPQFQLGFCCFHDNDTFVLYYYGLKSVCVISSVCLSISTVLNIKRFEKDTSLRLTDSESKCYNDNKKWFNLYLKLFVMQFLVMGTRWSLVAMSRLSGNLLNYYITFMINLLEIVQNFCIFIIFVWKKKIKMMLLKRF
ncbi:G-protein coupled receptor Mth2-like [Nylanderia fulva]|uniref:G-protein coupled receptor Mth2-like n=1 Tax=Nylanderia fulva TaxID=613905 RepID=UPI0010FAF0AF|nr:G-protein coupled receptor Mth2-like [Nylanderia fulva]